MSSIGSSCGIGSSGVNGKECCIVEGCSSRLFDRNNPDPKSNTPYKYHRFPRNESLLKLWLSSLKVKNHLPSDRVCNLHFTDGDYMLTNLGWKVLLPGVVPSLHLPDSDSSRTMIGATIKENYEFLEVPLEALVKVEIKEEIDDCESVTDFTQNFMSEDQDVHHAEEESEGNVADDQAVVNDKSPSESESSANHDANFGNACDHERFRCPSFRGEEEAGNVRSKIVRKKSQHARSLPFTHKLDVVRKGSNKNAKEEVSKDLTCYDCGREFSSRLFLLMHISIHNDLAGGLFCDDCEKTYLNECKYKYHKVKGLCHHKSPKKNHPPQQGEKSSAPPTFKGYHKAKYNFRCIECGKVFHSCEDLEEHYENHVKCEYDQNLCSKSLS